MVRPKPTRTRWFAIGLSVLLLGTLGTIVPAQANPHPDTAPAPSDVGGASPGGATPNSIQERLTPPSWHEHWERDRDGNGLDDALDALARLEPDTLTTADVLESASHGVETVRWALDDGALVADVFVRYTAESWQQHATDDPLPLAASLARLAGLPETHARAFPTAHVVHLRGVPIATVEALLGEPGVAGVEAERYVFPTLATANAAARISTSQENGLGAWNRFHVDGREVTIAVLDTGVDQEHPAFDAGRRYVGGYDATAWLIAEERHNITGTMQRNAGDDPLGFNDPDSDDLFTHGTHVAGIALGRDRDGLHLGAGYGADLVDIKVLAREIRLGPVGTGTSSLGTEGIASGTGSSVLEGIEFIQRFNRGTSYLGANITPIQIAVMSFAEAEPDMNGTSVLATAANNLVASNVSVVAAAGNCGPDATVDSVFGPCSRIGTATIAAPGSARDVITVASVTDNGTVRWGDDRVDRTSSFGWGADRRDGNDTLNRSAKPDLAAYGVEISSARGDPRPNTPATENRYHNLTGTSMAAPMVAGTIALMLEVDRTLTPAAIKQIMIDTARPFPDTRTTEAEKHSVAYGHGILEARHAVARAMGAMDQDEIEELYASILDDRYDIHFEDCLPPDHEDDGDHSHDEPVCTEVDPQNADVDEEVEEEERPNFYNNPPAVDFRIVNDGARVGDVVTFIDETFDHDDDELVRWVWAFGDGDTAHEPVVKHIYDLPGTYKVKLTVTDRYGNYSKSGWNTHEVTVLPGEESQESPGAPVLISLLTLALAVALMRRRNR